MKSLVSTLLAASCLAMGCGDVPPWQGPAHAPTGSIGDAAGMGLATPTNAAIALLMRRSWRDPDLAPALGAVTSATLVGESSLVLVDDLGDRAWILEVPWGMLMPFAETCAFPMLSSPIPSSPVLPAPPLDSLVLSRDRIAVEGAEGVFLSLSRDEQGYPLVDVYRVRPVRCPGSRGT